MNKINNIEQMDDFSNIPQSILKKYGTKLHNIKNHPVEIIKNKIYEFFDSLKDYKFDKFDNLSPIVTIENNFDKLLIPKDHPARKKTDTYYINKNLVLRTHTTAHQNELLSCGYNNFLVTGDVYRKDEIDRNHYPIFHQMEGVIKVINNDELLEILSNLVNFLFPGCKYRVNDDYFPFTNPSYEIEVLYNDQWLEILGCGIIQPEILKNNNLDGNYVAFGLGLERLVMIMFDIPDIRYLWSTHERFINQFKDGVITKFKPYSELPNVTKDISFWIPSDKIICNDNDDDNKDVWIDENDFFELARDMCDEWIEEIKLMDKFYHQKKKQHARMYRIIYSPNDPSLKDPSQFNTCVNKIQDNLRNNIDEKLNVVLR